MYFINIDVIDSKTNSTCYMLTKALNEEKKKTRKQERKANRIVRLDFENS